MAKSGFRDLVCSQVAQALREERERKKISMTRLAEMAGLSQGMISMIEHEKRNPTLETLLRICDALEIRLSTLISRAEREAGKSPSRP